MSRPHQPAAAFAGSPIDNGRYPLIGPIPVSFDQRQTRDRMDGGPPDVRWVVHSAATVDVQINLSFQDIVVIFWIAGNIYRLFPELDQAAQPGQQPGLGLNINTRGALSRIHELAPHVRLAHIQNLSSGGRINVDVLDRLIHDFRAEMHTIASADWFYLLGSLPDAAALEFDSAMVSVRDRISEQDRAVPREHTRMPRSWLYAFAISWCPAAYDVGASYQDAHSLLHENRGAHKLPQAAGFDLHLPTYPVQQMRTSIQRCFMSVLRSRLGYRPAPPGATIVEDNITDPTDQWDLDLGAGPSDRDQCSHSWTLEYSKARPADKFTAVKPFGSDAGPVLRLGGLYHGIDRGWNFKVRYDCAWPSDGPLHTTDIKPEVRQTCRIIVIFFKGYDADLSSRISNCKPAETPENAPDVIGPCNSMRSLMSLALPRRCLIFQTLTTPPEDPVYSRSFAVSQTHLYRPATDAGPVKQRLGHTEEKHPSKCLGTDEDLHSWKSPGALAQRLDEYESRGYAEYSSHRTLPPHPITKPLQGLKPLATADDASATFRAQMQQASDGDAVLAKSLDSRRPQRSPPGFSSEFRQACRGIPEQISQPCRNTAEVLRVVDSLQTGDKHKITTPINWVPGDDVIVHPAVSNDQAKGLFPEFRIVKPYLRFTPLPKEKATVA
ncbi:uncharacterized protein B0I36DRAFT_350744 [Microdochium trichocladiopsis]|uniref:Peroxiredoxin C-terminal domain-containing protein n=1 Tax=Microdochium trichocladiopsis TaxID=1682393 RepID=A0A9P9BNA0_9PEZI|nr:uncharacterized protein B0I36DRAFT_350744 [Microdochium trichocladiopsis]KAH7027174.1 hypothetical protein B0I36DRAFT_350744 [Microdochium trichocladiopsis]